MIALIVVAAVVVLLVLALVATYNGLVKKRNQCKNAWSQIEVQTTKRHDLVPNLVATVKGYATHEQQTLTNVTAARNAAVAATGPQAQATAEAGLSGALRQVFALSENYPDLKANTGFLELQSQLGSIESAIAYARQYYNDAVQTYENSRTTFPHVVVAGPMGFHEIQLFNSAPGSDAPVTVSF